VAAAEKFGIRADGVDIDPRRIAQAKVNARKHGVQDRVEFLLGEKKVNLSEATVVTLFWRIADVFLWPIL
jgi:23S rRNA G2445 N2-methylase RlmL